MLYISYNMTLKDFKMGLTRHLTSACLFAVLATNVYAQQKPVYLDDTKNIEQRIDDALSRMTLDEKIAVIHAQSKFSSPGVKRLGFSDFWTDDGPHGVRPDVLWDEWEQAGQTNDSCVAFPALTCHPSIPAWLASTVRVWVRKHATVARI